MTTRDRALELLTRLITENTDADPGCTARECLVAIEGLGYRPTAARPPAEWKLHGTGTGPSEETRAELEAAKQRAAEATARFRDDEQDGAA
jgi:hypothetical protein